MSTAYIYKFFESKRAIGAAVCGRCLGEIRAELRRAAAEPATSADRLRTTYRILVHQSAALLFNDRRLHDIVAAAVHERWNVADAYQADVLDLVRGLVTEGRAAGEFERKTPLEETCRAILQTMAPFMHPVLLERNLGRGEEDAVAVANLVLRSLAP